MRTRLLACAALLLVTSASAVEPPPPASNSHGDAARIAGALLTGGQALALVEELGDRFGGRLTGSPAHVRSAEWAAEKMRSFGLSNVKLENFPLRRTWQRGAARGRVLKPFEAPLHLESMGWSPATPKGGVRAELVMLKEFTPEGLAKILPTLKGKAVLFNRPSGRTPGERPSPKIIGMMLKALDGFADAGVAVLLIGSNDEVVNNVVATGGIGFSGNIARIPIAALGYEDARMLVRRAEQGPITVEVDLANRPGPAGQAPNVIGEIRGEPAGEWIIIGAHLDSWDFATGSQDNGSGVAQVLDAARVLAKMGRPPRRSIRFALWGGEEEGLLGSTAYVRAHDAELGDCVAALNTDNGAGHPKGWKVQGRSDLELGLGPIARSLAGLGGATIEKTTTFDTDHAAFFLAGIPALDMLVDGGNYSTVHHRISDTFEKIEPHNLAAGAAVLAVTAWAIAEAPERIAPRRGREAIAKALDEGEYTDLLKQVGMWK